MSIFIFSLHCFIFCIPTNFELLFESWHTVKTKWYKFHFINARRTWQARKGKSCCIFIVKCIVYSLIHCMYFMPTRTLINSQSRTGIEGYSSKKSKLIAINKRVKERNIFILKNLKKGKLLKLLMHSILHIWILQKNCVYILFTGVWFCITGSRLYLNKIQCTTIFDTDQYFFSKLSFLTQTPSKKYSDIWSEKAITFLSEQRF